MVLPRSIFLYNHIDFLHYSGDQKILQMREYLLKNTKRAKQTFMFGRLL